MSPDSDAWDKLFRAPRPAELHPFREIRSGNRHAVSTPGDILFPIRAKRMDLCFELVMQIIESIGGVVSVADEVHGFGYFDDRDVMGFADGTENPRGGPNRIWRVHTTRRASTMSANERNPRERRAFQSVRRSDGSL